MGSLTPQEEFFQRRYKYMKTVTVFACGWFFFSIMCYIYAVPKQKLLTTYFAYAFGIFSFILLVILFRLRRKRSDG
jgi:hypothetical protein